MFRTLFIVALLCATLFHADASSLRRLRNNNGDEVSGEYLSLVSEVGQVDLIQQRQEQRTRRMPANPVVDEDDEIAELSMSLSMSMSMSMSM